MKTKACILPALAASLIVAAANPAVAVKLQIGDHIQTVSETSVWTTPPLAGSLAGKQPARVGGVLTGGPIRSGESWWWNVRYDNGQQGWTSERQIHNAQGQAPAPRLAASLTLPQPPSGESLIQSTPVNGSTVHQPDVILQGNVAGNIYAPSLVGFYINGNKVSLQANGDFRYPLRLSPGQNTFNLETRTPNPRQQFNEISAFLDGSVIYGCDAIRAAALRAFRGGLLKTSEGNLPPLNTIGLPNANDAHLVPDEELFLCGDVRANENVELSAIHALFVREHNSVAAAISSTRPNLSDEQLFQEARRIVVAELQIITYREFLPALLGNNALRPYAGFKPQVNPGIATEFSTAAYRIGHTLINDDVELLDNDAGEVDEPLELAEAFFNPSVLAAFGPAPMLKYLASDNAQEVDAKLVGGLRNFLFGPPGSGGFDLACLNIQRGRDHGLSGYNATRQAYGLPRVTSFAQITADPGLQTRMASLYGSVDSIDLWIAGLCEDHLPGSSVGPTFQRIIADQFERIRDGDRNWYGLTFAGPQLEAIERTKLSDVIRRNTEITKLQDNVFFFDAAALPLLQPKAPTPLPVALLVSLGLPPRPASLDGTGHNEMHPTWGSAGVDLMRWAPAAYSDGLSAPAGTNRPSARLVSNLLCDYTASVPNNRKLSDWIYGWGQFIDHDLDLTTSGDVAFDITVPAGDPYFDPKGTGAATIYFNRSVYDSTSGTATTKVDRKTVTLTFSPKAPLPR
jgi:Animal haem peroxidase